VAEGYDSDHSPGWEGTKAERRETGDGRRRTGGGKTGRRERRERRHTAVKPEQASHWAHVLPVRLHLQTDVFVRSDEKDGR
jgi:hypothetical protein